MKLLIDQNLSPRLPRLHPLFDGCDDLLSSTAILIAEGVLRQCLAEALEHTIVIHNQAEVLAGVRG